MRKIYLRASVSGREEAKGCRIEVTIIGARVILPYSISSITVNSPRSSTQSMAKQVM